MRSVMQQVAGSKAADCQETEAQDQRQRSAGDPFGSKGGSRGGLTLDSGRALHGGRALAIFA
jgi:hypothetical protein